MRYSPRLCASRGAREPNGCSSDFMGLADINRGTKTRVVGESLDSPTQFQPRPPVIARSRSRQRQPPHPSRQPRFLHSRLISSPTLKQTCTNNRHRVHLGGNRFLHYLARHRGISHAAVRCFFQGNECTHWCPAGTSSEFLPCLVLALSRAFRKVLYCSTEGVSTQIRSLSF